jgi:hypothetical protein
MRNRQPGRAEEHNGLARVKRLPKILKLIESISGTTAKKSSLQKVI